MNAKLCKRLRGVVKNWREVAYVVDKQAPFQPLELPVAPDGHHYKIPRIGPAPILVVNPIRLNPRCGRKMYQFLKQRAKHKMTVVPG